MVNLGFVGRQEDAEAGLYQLGARWYNPELGRFYSVDPVPGSLNQYSYAFNNPFRYSDANGRQASYFGIGGIGDIIAMLKAQGYLPTSAQSIIMKETAQEYSAAGAKAVVGASDIGSCFVPGLNDARDLQECTTGYDIPAQEYLPWYWQGGACFGVVAGNAAAIRKIGMAGVLTLGLVKEADDIADAARAGKSIYHYHHPIAKFLGGFADQDLARIPKEYHEEFHGLLWKKLGERGIKRPGAGRIEEWDAFFKQNPEKHTEAFGAIIEASQEMDFFYGTDLYYYFMQNFAKGNFTSY